LFRQRSLAASQAPQAEEARRVVMALSGRQMEHGKKYTHEGLLAGMWVLLAMAALLEQMSPSRLKDIATFVLGGSAESPPALSTPLREAG
jgi:hypothetical protein